MKLTKHCVQNGCVTSYRLIVGSKEARDAGLLNEDGTARPIKKIVDVENRRLIVTLDEDTDAQG